MPSAVFALSFVLLGWIASHSITYALVGVLPHGHQDHHVPGLWALFGTSYDRALATKLGVLIFLLGYGAQNLRLQGRESFGLLVSFELILAICIFGVTGFLTSLPPADADQTLVKESQTAQAEGLR